MARKFWKTGIGEMYRSFSRRAFWHALRRLIPEVKFADLVPAGAGVGQPVEMRQTMIAELDLTPEKTA